jgi:hypothetical protein
MSFLSHFCIIRTGTVDHNADTSCHDREKNLYLLDGVVTGGPSGTFSEIHV